MHNDNGQVVESVDVATAEREDHAFALSWTSPILLRLLTDDEPFASEILADLLARLAEQIRTRGNYELRGTLPELFPAHITGVDRLADTSFETSLRPALTNIRKRAAITGGYRLPGLNREYLVTLYFETPGQHGAKRHPYVFGVHFDAAHDDADRTAATNEFPAMNSRRQALLKAGLVNTWPYPSAALGLIWRIAAESLRHLWEDLFGRVATLPLHTVTLGAPADPQRQLTIEEVATMQAPGLVDTACDDILRLLGPLDKAKFLWLTRRIILRPSALATEATHRRVVQSTPLPPHPAVEFDDDYFRLVVSYSAALTYPEKMALLETAERLEEHQVATLLDICGGEYRELMQLDTDANAFAHDEQEADAEALAKIQNTRDAYLRGEISDSAARSVTDGYLAACGDKLDRFLRARFKDPALIIRHSCEKITRESKPLIEQMRRVHGIADPPTAKERKKGKRQRQRRSSRR